MRILLFGGNGQVGTELRRSLAPMGEVIATTRSGVLPDGELCEQADFNAPETLAALIDCIAPDIVVNAAAHTAVDRAEDEMEVAFRANSEAPRLIAEACTRRDALLVHYSTDYVFDGHGTRPYREDDPVAPLGIYGASKLAGEQAIRDSGARHLIFRTAWVYAAHGDNFLRTMLRLADERDELRVVADQIGSPTPASLVADVTTAVLLRSPDASQSLHLTASGQTSWHGFAEAIFEQANATGLLQRIPKLIPIASSGYRTRAERPGYSVLDCSRLAADFRLDMPHWQSALKPVLASIRASREMATQR